MFSKNKCTLKIWVLFGGIALSIFLYDAACQAEMMYACVNKFTKSMRMVDDAGACSRYFESAVSWNNVPQSELDAHAQALAAAQATIAQLTEQLTLLETEKVEPISRRVDTLEQEEIPDVSRRIDETRTRVTDVEVDLRDADSRITETGTNVDTIRDTLEDADTGVIVRLNESDARVVSLEETVDDADARVVVLEEALALDDEDQCVISKVDRLEETLAEDVTPIISELDADRAAALSQLATYMRVENVAASQDPSTTETLIATEASTPVIIFEGVNVHIRSGLGATDDGGSGLGNLIIGYNEIPEETAEETVAARKTASHNLVIGPEHTYDSIGGLVAGYKNTVSGDYVTVAGGELNTANGFAVTVSGGTQNIATDDLPLMPFDAFFGDSLQ